MIVYMFELKHNPDAFRACKKAVQVRAEFMRSSGTLHTREGLVSFHAGDVVLTGVEGERWPVPRERFDDTYEPVFPTRTGQDGRYVKRPMTVLALRVGGAVDLELADGRGTLHADAGDVIVQYGPNDLAVVGGAIFEKTYVVLDA